jgi:hypothetical protein
MPLDAQLSDEAREYLELCRDEELTKLQWWHAVEKAAEALE